jgi:hypothetical protein
VSVSVRRYDDLRVCRSGRTIFFGEWRDAVSYFDALGYMCPTYTNPTDYFMTVTKDADVASQLADAHAAVSRVSARPTGQTPLACL